MDGGRAGEKQIERVRERVCVCVCKRERERKIHMSPQANVTLGTVEEEGGRRMRRRRRTRRRGEGGNGGVDSQAHVHKTPARCLSCDHYALMLSYLMD
jgi:hypothetical protein